MTFKKLLMTAVLLTAVCFNFYSQSSEQTDSSVQTELSSFEKQVIELHIAGMGYAEIAGILGKEAKSTDNALQRAKAKLRKHLSF